MVGCNRFWMVLVGAGRFLKVCGRFSKDLVGFGRFLTGSGKCFLGGV